MKKLFLILLAFAVTGIAYADKVKVVNDKVYVERLGKPSIEVSSLTKNQHTVVFQGNVTTDNATVTLKYSVVGDTVTINIPEILITGSGSDSAIHAQTPIPENIRSSQELWFVARGQDGSNGEMAVIRILTTGAISIYRDFTTLTSWSASVIHGISLGTSITYKK